MIKNDVHSSPAALKSIFIGHPCLFYSHPRVSLLLICTCSHLLCCRTCSPQTRQRLCCVDARIKLQSLRNGTLIFSRQSWSRTRFNSPSSVRESSWWFVSTWQPRPRARWLQHEGFFQKTACSSQLTTLTEGAWRWRVVLPDHLAFYSAKSCVAQFEILCVF